MLANKQSVYISTTLNVVVKTLSVIMIFNIHTAYATVLKANGGEKLWDWLSEKQEKNNKLDPNTLVWQSVSERNAQKVLKQTMINELDKLQDTSQHQEAVWLKKWLQDLPVTGRVSLPFSDARLMQINPKFSPILARNDTVYIYEQPSFVNVVSDEGDVCTLDYTSGVRSNYYVDKCDLDADVAYVIQPNGSVHKQSIASWNKKVAMVPLAGALIWVPTRRSVWSSSLLDESMTQKLLSLLATQGTTINLPTRSLQVTRSEQSNTASRGKDALHKYKQKSINQSFVASDWGIVGLLQTPTARMNKSGQFAFNYTVNQPYTYYNIALQPFDNFEVAMRFTDIGDRAYAASNEGQTLKDKSLDVKIKLLNESYLLPSLAVGLRDPIGTGLFDGEYFVANKRYHDFDVSLGIGFGYLGNRGSISNPFGMIDDSFNKRNKVDTGKGGKPRANSLFTGKTSLFGGIQWQTPYEPLIMKLEYDGNDYQNEPAGISQFTVDSPVNLGLVWHTDSIDVSVAFERGNQLSAGITLSDSLTDLTPTPQSPKAVGYFANKQEVLTVKTASDITLNDFNKKTNLTAKNIYKDHDTWHIAIDNKTGLYLNKKIQKGVSVLHRDADRGVKYFHIDLYEQNTLLQSIKIDRQIWLRQQQQLVPTHSKKDTITVTQSYDQPPIPQELRKFGYTIAPEFSQGFGGPDGYLFSASLSAGTYIPLWHNAWVDGSAKLRLLDNYGKYDFEGGSQLPTVRTRIQKYLTSSRVNVTNAQINQFYQVSPSLFFLGYAGYLESMYAGAGMEVMYRPNQSSWALGADINYVKKRDFKQHFELQDYDVNTGHVNLYWNTGWNDIHTKISAGQYLAGDKGVTLDISRQFENGVEMGAWATKTDVSSEKFGEGSFDKGVYFRIPFQAFSDDLATTKGSFVWQPIVRDGGARLNKNTELWDLTHSYDPLILKYKTKLFE